MSSLLSQGYCTVVNNARHNPLNRMLEDESAEPMHLSLSLLEDITNCFSEDRQIGIGGFAVVYKGIVGHGMVAVKKLSNTFDLEETKFHKEVECLVKAKHKNIVRFLGYCAETQGQIENFEGKFVMADRRNWLLCFEYVPNGSLDNYITDASCGLEWSKRLEIIKGICDGLCYLHDKRIIHLDLKPANILISDHMVPKITDFGLSRCLSEEQTRIITSRLIGSMGYLAPEFFRGQVAFASDIYSLGIIIMEMLTGKKGYPEDESVIESWRNRLEGDVQLEQVKVCTNIAIECMELDPKKRPAARHIIDRLDKMPSVVETCIISSAVELRVSLLKDQHCQERGGNTFAADIKDVTQQLQTLGKDQCQEKEDQWSILGSQDTKQDPKDASISSSNSSVSQKFNFSDDFHRNFLRNGGPTIQQSGCVQIFRKEELEPILNRGSLVTSSSSCDIYEGILGNRLVAVRKLDAEDLPESADFAKEVIERSQVIHKNILGFIGCCLEVDVPMLVYEFVSNGSLREILQNNHKVLNMSLRLRIVVQATDGLIHVRSDPSHEFLLSDIDATHILLDDDFVPMISDFAVWRPTNEQEGDYFYGQPGEQITEDILLTRQGDAYNIGIIILELITRKKVSRDDGNGLVRSFLTTGGSFGLLDNKEMLQTKRDFKTLRNLRQIATECLSVNVNARPKMTEVAERLHRLLDWDVRRPAIFEALEFFDC